MELVIFKDNQYWNVVLENTGQGKIDLFICVLFTQADSIVIKFWKEHSIGN